MSIIIEAYVFPVLPMEGLGIYPLTELVDPLEVCWVRPRDMNPQPRLWPCTRVHVHSLQSAFKQKD